MKLPVVYAYEKCSTCKKALKFLEENGVSFEMKHIKEEPPTPEVLREAHKNFNGEVKKLFNTSGIKYRELGLAEKLKEMSLDEALELLSSDGMLVKRPFLWLKGEATAVGFKEETWKKVLLLS